MSKGKKRLERKAPKEKSSKKTTRSKQHKKEPQNPIMGKQASYMMKQKYIQKLTKPSAREEDKSKQAPEQVEQTTQWAVEELTSASGHIVRKGREYAKEKAIEAGSVNHESDSIPADTSADTQGQPSSALKKRRQKESRPTNNFPKEKGLSEPEEKAPMLKRRRPQQTTKSLKERSINYKIKERPPIGTPKTSGKPLTTPAASHPRRPILTGADQSASDRLDIPTAPFTKDGDAHMKPQMAVPMEQRRAFLERKKASPYTTQEPVHTPHTSDPANIAQPPIASPQIPGKALPRGSSTEGKQTAIKERSPFRSKPKSREPATKAPLSPKLRQGKEKTAAPISRHPTAASKAAAAARRQAQKEILAKPRKAVRTIEMAFKRIAQAGIRTASAVSSAVSAVICCGILLTSLVIVIIIAAVANSPFGLFYAQEPNAPGTVSVSQAVGSVNVAYNAKLEELQTGDYDSIDIQGSAPDWTEVLAVFAVKLAGSEVDGLDVATLDADRVNKLTVVFWDMTVISTEVETIDHPANGSQEAWTEKILHITITAKSADDMRTFYSFTPYQNSALDELLGDRPTLSSLAGSLDITGAGEREVLAALPADLEHARRDTVEKALSLVGKVNYFWGGKSHAIGWDDRWGTLRKVTAAGSPSTGTYRPFGLDCSGMIDWALRNAGLPSDGNWYIGTNLTRVSVSEAHPGDMALFSDASHIGIIVGRNDAGKLLVCHCSSGRNNVVVSEFSATGFTVVGRPRFFS